MLEKLTVVVPNVQRQLAYTLVLSYKVFELYCEPVADTKKSTVLPERGFSLLLC